MKRSGNILIVLLLSFMVVYLSVGTTVMHCLRYNTVKIGAVDDCCQKKDQRCCGFSKNCMQYKQVKLSPTMVSQDEADFDATPLFVGIMPCCWSKFPRPLLANVLSDNHQNMDVPHSPPRSYLTFIRVLQI